MTEQYLCKSYADDDGVVQDCTCGKCNIKSTDELSKIINTLIAECAFRGFQEGKDGQEPTKFMMYVHERQVKAMQIIKRQVLLGKIDELQHFWEMGAEHGIDNRIAQLEKELEELK